MNALAKIHFFFIISLVGVVFFSCYPTEKFPREIFLEYVACQHFSDGTRDTALNLQVRFQKGDGNLGLEKRDTTHPYVGKYAHNLYVYAFDKDEDGTYKPIQIEIAGHPIDIVFPYQIPILTTNPKSSLKGILDIRVRGLSFDRMQAVSKQGVIRFEIYMYSRDVMPNGDDLEQSNIITTPDIRIK